MISLGSMPWRYAEVVPTSVSELALDDVDRDALTGEFDRVGVAQLVFVPTSAQTPLCRRLRYAQFDASLAGIPGSRCVEVGITRPIRRALAVASH